MQGVVTAVLVEMLVEVGLVRILVVDVVRVILVLIARLDDIDAVSTQFSKPFSV